MLEPDHYVDRRCFGGRFVGRIALCRPVVLADKRYGDNFWHAFPALVVCGGPVLYVGIECTKLGITRIPDSEGADRGIVEGCERVKNNY